MDDVIYVQPLTSDKYPAPLLLTPNKYPVIVNAMVRVIAVHVDYKVSAGL